jgi:isopentenyl diphosphate isomerase/L-lactate dehydrogenase-like FMN-dependent dehydrogenase
VSRAGRIQSVADARYFAERRLPRPVREFVRGGSGERRTLAANTAAFGEITFRPRSGVTVPAVDTRTTVLGHELALPVMIAPTGGARLVHPAGESAGARAAGATGTMQWVSAFAGTRIEEVMASATGPVGFQLYYPGSVDAAKEMIDRVAAAGCSALAVTIDTSVGPRPEIPARGRVTNYRAGGSGPRPLVEYVHIARYFGTKPGWTTGFLRDRGRALNASMVLVDGRPARVYRAAALLMRRPPVWQDIGWIRERWPGSLVVKGIVTPHDAQLAVDHGVDGIVVSNHGGNVLDGNPPAISMLPAIAQTVDGRVEILFDSGIRRGSDVVKALALGAKAVLVGRSWLWGLAAAGEAGVRAVLDVYHRQVTDTLRQLGCASLEDVSRDMVAVPAHWLGALVDSPAGGD